MMRTQLIEDEKMLNIIHNDENIIDMEASPCSSENDAEITGL